MIGYLKLVRLPNVFTSISNIVAAWIIVYIISKKELMSGWMPIESSKVGWLVLSSAALYMAGMAFNDIADREEDARIRPNRPIPSGAVSLNGAIFCGVGLMLVGLFAAFLASPTSLYFALPLAVAILTYDFVAKRGKVLGIATLGVCRFLNVMLGLSIAADRKILGFNLTLDDSHFQYMKDHSALWLPPICIGFYAAGVTAFSAQEEGGKRNSMIVFGWLLALVGLAAGYQTGFWAMLGIFPLAAWLIRCTMNLIQIGGPLEARDLVRSGVMGICVLDASLIMGFGGREWIYAAIPIALLPIPGLYLGKWLAQKEA